MVTDILINVGIVIEQEMFMVYKIIDIVPNITYENRVIGWKITIETSSSYGEPNPFNKTYILDEKCMRYINKWFGNDWKNRRIGFTFNHDTKIIISIWPLEFPFGEDSPRYKKDFGDRFEEKLFTNSGCGCAIAAFGGILGLIALLVAKCSGY